MATYSFQDVVATIVGPGGVIPIGSDSGVAEEGITITPSKDRNEMTIGADGEVQHALNADTSGTITINLLKTSLWNAALQALLVVQTLGSTSHGQNTIVVSDVARGDLISATQVAFKRQPDLRYATKPGMTTWVFDCGKISPVIGAGLPNVNL